MAKRVSKEIFSVFGWKQVGRCDIDWDCSTPNHNKETHPSDVVFWYDDPYTPDRVFINTDLKSYGGTSIDRAKIGGALRSLSMAVECANLGPHWREEYDDGGATSKINGMLFVYNHDANYKDDGHFSGLLNTVSKESLAVPQGHGLTVFGPTQVSFLYTVASDIKALRGEDRLPRAGRCKFWYADLVRTKRRSQEISAATIEMLTGPWIIMRYDLQKSVLWYRGRGSSVEEFRYLLECIFFYQLMNNDEAHLLIRLVNSDHRALARFAAAKEKFFQAHHSMGAERLEQIECEPVTAYRPVFSTTPVGW